METEFLRGALYLISRAWLAKPPAPEVPMTRPFVRTMAMKDYPAVEEIDRVSFKDCWNTPLLKAKLISGDGLNALVAVVGESVVAFLLYEVRAEALEVVRVAVHPSARRRGIGRMLVESVREVVSSSGRPAVIGWNVRETNLDATYFLKQMRFTAKLVPGHYANGDDAYRFTISVPGPKVMAHR